MKRLNARLQRLEQQIPERPARCPACPPVTFITEDADGNIIEGEYPKRCRTCGGPHGGVSFVIVSTQRTTSRETVGQLT
jgi:hypothetical protein